MRKIVFRIKDIDIWYYGFPLREVRPEDLYIPFQGEDENGNSFYSISVDVKTLGQFTGLCDKNGKKIFEGDIVKGTIVSSWAKQKIKCKVIYEKDRFVCIDIDGGVHKIMFGKDIAVIGNIYDNPELLKGE